MTVEITSTFDEAPASDPDTLGGLTLDEIQGDRGSPSQAQAVEPRQVWNATADRIVVKCRGGRQLQLSPLEVAGVTAADVTRFALDDLADQQIVQVMDPKQSKELDPTPLLGLVVWLFIPYVFLLFRMSSWWGRVLFGLAAPLATLLVCRVVFKLLTQRNSDVGFIASLVLVVAIGAGLPIGAMFAFGGLGPLISAGASTELFGRLAQTLFIVIASLLPALLYYLFDRQRAMTIRRQFQQQILRLDPCVHNLYDVAAKYGDQVSESVGRDGVHSQHTQCNHTPIFLATVLISLGWVLTLPITDRALLSSDPSNVSPLLTPQRTTYVFGFLGAYFFTINLIARRYVRGDLRPKAYGSITVRLLTTFVLAWMLEVLFKPGNELYIVAFVVGILPETFFTLLSETQRALLRKLPNMREPLPLTRLEGIDLYDRARLQDEGVNNIEALAHHDLVSLMLATRIPVPRLVDWVDQAILYLHTANEQGEGPMRKHLRTYGIRTASDLQVVKQNEANWKLLTKGNDDDGPRSRLNLVQQAIADDEWMIYVAEWRRPDAAGTRWFTVCGAQAVESEESSCVCHAIPSPLVSVPSIPPIGGGNTDGRTVRVPTG
jgi:hypothetical protein